MRDLLVEHPKDLSDRIHFLGAQTDDAFLSGMAICDAVVFPYIEVGQSSSGPISQALELGCRVIASRTHTFLQFARYHRKMVEFFDIGNHLELAGRILARPQFDPSERIQEFNVETNKAIYLAANGGTHRAEVPAVDSRVRVQDPRQRRHAATTKITRDSKRLRSYDDAKACPSPPTAHWSPWGLPLKK
jgi:hypothetical protein